MSSQPVGYLLGKAGLLAVLACLLLAAWFGQTVIVVALGLVIAVAGLSKLWSRASLKNVGYERQISERRIFPGEYLELKMRLSNDKLLPLPWIDLNDEIPAGLVPENGGGAGEPPGSLDKTAALPWYSSVSWRHRLCGSRRGYYTLGPAVLSTGDIFGFYPRTVTLPLTEHIIVYPRVFPVARLGIPSLHPVGETTAERRIFEDPIRLVGVRDYQPYDSLRRIHWKASARHGNLQVKVFEPTTTLKAAVFLAVESFIWEDEPPDEGDAPPPGSEAAIAAATAAAERRAGRENNFELGISTAASVASYLTEQRSSVGLFVNSQLAGTGLPAEIMPGRSSALLQEILEALARVTGSPSGDFGEFFQTQRPGLPWGTTLVFVISRTWPGLEAQLFGLKESGQRITVFQIGEHPEDGSGQAGIPWHRVRQPSDLGGTAPGEAA